MFRLALALGHASVDKLAHELMPDEVDEWLAYYWLEPFGNEVHSQAMTTAAAMNTAALVNYGRAGKSPPANALVSERQIMGGPAWLVKENKRVLSDEESQRRMCRGLDKWQ